MFSYDLLVLVLIVNPELRSKLNDMFNYFFFWSIVGAQFANILTAFTIYFDFSAIHILQNIFHAVFTIFFACCLIQWTKAIAVKQNVSCIRFDRLSTEEFAALSYIIPIFLSVVFQFIYTLSTGEQLWQDRSQTSLLVHMTTIYIVCMALICKIFDYLCVIIAAIIGIEGLIL